MGQVYFLLSLYVPRRSAVCHLGAQTDGGGTIRDKVCFHRPSAAAAAVATNWGVTRGPLFTSTWPGQSRGPPAGGLRLCGELVVSHEQQMTVTDAQGALLQQREIRTET